MFVVAKKKFFERELNVFNNPFLFRLLLCLTNTYFLIWSHKTKQELT